MLKNNNCIMHNKRDGLAYEKRIRTYSKRLVTTLSTALLIGYIATFVFNISGFSLHFAIAGAIISAISLALNVWSLTDHFRKQNTNKESGIENTSEQKKKLTKIYLDITSSVLFLIGGVVSLVCNIATLPLYEASIIYFASTSLFTLGCAVMVINTIKWLTDSKAEENNNVQVEQHSSSKIGQGA